jgi:bacillithiol biosynthesis cysteine-adding enzyme BshC
VGVSHASVFSAYVAGDAKAFFASHFADPDARARATMRAVRPLAARTIEALRAQNARLAPSAARDAHLDALQAGAAAVVTGQQVGLFLGPLYTLYKAASAIAVSRALARETGKPIVPVFWLQTEDHDLPEVASCTLPRDGLSPLTLDVPSAPEARVSLAHCVLPAEVEQSTAALRAELERLPHAREHLERIERAYRPGATWGDAFAQVIGELFAPEGLVLINPRDPALAEQTAAVHAQALHKAEAIASALAAHCAQLRAAGFEPQVHVRPGAPLSFFHAAGAHGARSRLMPCERGYRRVAAASEPAVARAEDAEHTVRELLDTLARDPLSFSTSALLRPIVQDTLLPTAAYVGGPGEIAYFAQLAPLYAAFDMPMPVIVPRARFRVVEDKMKRLLDRLQLTPDDATRDAASLAAAHASRTAAFSPEQLEQMLRTRFDEALESALAQTGPLREQLRPAHEKTKAAVHAAAGKLAEKHRNALGHQNEALLRDIERLKQALQPAGEPQERVYGFSYYAARYGERPFIEGILRALETSDPFDPSVRDLQP